MCNFCEINEQNSCNSYKMNIKSQKRIKLTNYKTQTFNTSVQPQTIYEMDSTLYPTIAESANETLSATPSTLSSCTCRIQRMTQLKQTGLSTIRLIHLIQILLLFTALPLIFTLQNIVVTAAPSHQSNTPLPVFPEAASLVANTVSTNSLNATEISILETILKTNVVPTVPGASGASTNHEHSRGLKKVPLVNRTVVCNDGTTAGFYLRKNPNSKKWIVFLEGGWHCYDEKTCRTRWNRLRHLMTSSDWPETRDVGGILSASPEENPYWHSANHVLVPYCSSDSWSGTRDTIVSDDFQYRFMGATILKQVITEIIPMGLGRVPGAELLLVGSSAGGLGVMLNLDRITHFLQQERKLQVTVRGVSDSGWFLDREPYTPSAVQSSEAVRQGWSLWKGQLPDACVERYKSEPWRCYFGYRLYPTLKAPLFVFQWLFDEAQMRADNVAAPVTPHQWNYIHAMGGALRSSLDNVTAVFAPSCIGHAVLTKRDWLTLKIDDISLPTALRCWEHSTRPRKKRHDKLKRSTEATTIIQNDNNKRRHDKQHKEKQREKKKNNSNGNGNGEKKRLTKAEREERKRLRHEQQKRKEERRNRRKNNQENNLTNSIRLAENNTNTLEQQQEQQRKINKRKRNEQEKQKRQQNKQKKRQRRRKEHNFMDRLTASTQQDTPSLVVVVEKRPNSANKINRRSGVPRVPERCSLRLLERCSWPQCNHSCPTLINPGTGEEMRFLELLASFGLDMEAVAAALGVNMQTLNNMDRTELVNLLTQQVS